MPMGMMHVRHVWMIVPYRFMPMNVCVRLSCWFAWTVSVMMVFIVLMEVGVLN